MGAIAGKEPPILAEALWRMKSPSRTLDAVAYIAGTKSCYLSKIEIDTGKPSLKMLEQIAAALDTPVSSIFALSEGRGEKAKLPDDFTEDDRPCGRVDAKRRSFRALSPANRRIAVELLKALERPQTPS